MSCSWTRVSIWARAGSACTRMRILSGITSSHAGTVRSPASARATTNGVSSRDFAATSTMSLSLTRYEGMSTLRPLTRTCPWPTSWRAMSRLLAKPAR